MRMDAYIQQVIITVNQTYGLLFFTSHIHFFQTLKPSNTMIDVRDVIAGVERLELFKREGF